MDFQRLGAADVERVITAAHLFDHPPSREWIEDFFARDGHHLIFAAADGVDVGFVTGIEMAHPDKRVEMLLYELGVDESHRRQGIGRGLTLALAELAVEAGCRGMWVITDEDNEAALATYRSVGAIGPESGVTLEWRFDA